MHVGASVVFDERRLDAFAAHRVRATTTCRFRQHAHRAQAIAKTPRACQRRVARSAPVFAPLREARAGSQRLGNRGGAEHHQRYPHALGVESDARRDAVLRSHPLTLVQKAGAVGARSGVERVLHRANYRASPDLHVGVDQQHAGRCELADQHVERDAVSAKRTIDPVERLAQPASEAREMLTATVGGFAVDQQYRNAGMRLGRRERQRRYPFGAAVDDDRQRGQRGQVVERCEAMHGGASLHQGVRRTCGWLSTTLPDRAGRRAGSCQESVPAPPCGSIGWRPESTHPPAAIAQCRNYGYSRFMSSQRTLPRSLATALSGGLLLLLLRPARR